VLVNNEWEWMREKAVLAYLKVTGTEVEFTCVNYEKLRSGKYI